MQLDLEYDAHEYMYMSNCNPVVLFSRLPHKLLYEDKNLRTPPPQF